MNNMKKIRYLKTRCQNNPRTRILNVVDYLLKLGNSLTHSYRWEAIEKVTSVT